MNTQVLPTCYSKKSIRIKSTWIKCKGKGFKKKKNTKEKIINTRGNLCLCLKSSLVLDFPAFYIQLDSSFHRYTQHWLRGILTFIISSTAGKISLISRQTPGQAFHFENRKIYLKLYLDKPRKGFYLIGFFSLFFSGRGKSN